MHCLHNLNNFSFEFMFGIVIWHDILFAVNSVSKKLQSPSMCIDSALRQIECMMNYFANYRNEGFAASMALPKLLHLKWVWNHLFQ